MYSNKRYLHLHLSTHNFKMNRYVDAPPELLDGLIRSRAGVLGLIDGEYNSNNLDE